MELVADRYAVVRPLGEGGLASAFVVHDRVLGVELALKLVSADAGRILEREFLALRAAAHPHLVRVHDFGRWRDGAFYTSTLVHGGSLAAHARTWESARQPIADVLSALGALHARGLLHGDLHPGNVLVDRAGRGVLIDLSCARPIAGGPVSGTAGYIAPELLRGQAFRSSDLYALGKTIRSLDLALPAAIAQAVARMADERAERRPASAEEAALALDVPWRPTPASVRLGGALAARAPAMSRLRAALDALVRGTSAPRALAVVGPEGSGRTRLLEEAKLAAQLEVRTVLVPGEAGMVDRLLEVATASSLEARKVALLVDDADRLAPEDADRLRALLRLARPDGGALVVLAATAPVPGAETIAIAPLEREDLRSWLRGEVPEAALDELLRSTGGYPKEVAAVLGQLDGAAWDSRTLARAAARAAVGRLVLDDLDAHARAQLAEIVAAGSITAEPSTALLARGLVHVAPDGVRLLRRSDAVRAEAALGEDAMRAAHARLAENALATGDRVRAIRHLAFVDRPRATAMLLDTTDPASALRPAVDALARFDLAPDAAARCAELYADAGEPARALTLVARALRRRPAADHRGALRRIAGKAYAQMGDSRRAARTLTRLLPQCPATERGPVAAALALALLKRGADREALAVSEEALGGTVDDGSRLDLLLDAAYATSRLGDAARARVFIDRARGLEEGASPRARFRLASATGFVEYGAGSAASAMRAYKQSLELAERHGLDDLVASAALNYGSACHELGELGPALEAYTRGQAHASGMPTTSAILAFDRAKVLLDIGSFARAAHQAEAARADAQREGMALIEAGACAVLAQVAAARGEAAGPRFDEAERLAAAASPRERVALALQRARVEQSAAIVARVAPVVRELGMPDVEADLLAVRGALALAEGRTAEAIADLERGLELAGKALRPELEARLGEAFAAAGTPFLAERHRRRARELWEKTLAGLPPELHDEFRRHPLREAAFARNEAPEPRTPIDVRRLIEINRRLNSASTTAAVLEETMDAAIGIAGAERGFLLLVEPGRQAPRVAVARNLDRETIRQGNLKFSRTVAENVIRTGDPVVAIDAADDPRFTKARSVHAMKLKSVLCVPIRSPEGVLGAIYVDHRFSSGTFRPELADALLALGDQAAIAIVKARLVDELRKKTQELEQRNAEVERLAHGQALEIARLKRARDEGTPAKRRFDYGDLVARSPRMQRVLSVLDRVIDTDITVLVRGESGTGKERVARAIHANSARRSGPFVAINCGALPEPLLEAELFGYRRGAFSGAVRDHAGVFVSAGGGTLFLDELGEMPASMQVKLLRVLQERELRPLGGDDAIAVDVRLVCATNRDLTAEVRAGRFREDLFYRVAVVDVELPPLRERLQDVLPIAESVLARLAGDLGRPPSHLDRTAERKLLAHAWPGNVRELENVLTKAVLLAPSPALGADDLEIGESRSESPGPALRGKILAALEECDWNVVVAARLLAMPRATLYRKMRRYAIERPARSTA